LYRDFGDRTLATLFPPDAAGLEALARRALGAPAAIEPLAGDVGRRRYFRIHFPDNRSVVGVLYPADEADSRRRWVAAHAALSGRVRLPRLVADDDAGHQLVEDLGDGDLAARFAQSPPDTGAWLERAADTAAVIADTPDPGLNPPFDAALFRRELDLARQAVFELFLARPLSPGERAAHDAWAEALVREVLGHPVALCHRDYHANNLFPSGGEVAVIDFQDLRRGPDTYDLASLLWERTTLAWMTEETARTAVAHFASRRGVAADVLAGRMQRVLLQRAWKVCGTFARAIVERRADVYRRYLPGQLALVRRLLGGAREDRGFRAVLDDRCPPALLS
jgi:aminoglycoside/choline kinase family phosphotransferase